MKQIQFKVSQVAQAFGAYLDEHSTLDLVMVSAVSSIPSGERQHFAKAFQPFSISSSLKCKCDLIVKNSNDYHHHQNRSTTS